MNDIEVLEEMRDNIYGEMQFVDDIDIEKRCEKQFDALNLAIKSLKERQSDKERIKELEEMLKNRIKYTNELEKDLFENASNYVVPKSLIKEKIEELEEEKQYFYSDYAIEERNNKIQVLEELLKGE